MTCPRDCLACWVQKLDSPGLDCVEGVHACDEMAALAPALARRVHELEAEVAALRLGTPISVEAWKRAKKI